MAITKETSNSKVELILEANPPVIQFRETTRIMEDGAQIAEKHHRSTFKPLEAAASGVPEVQLVGAVLALRYYRSTEDAIALLNPVLGPVLAEIQAEEAARLAAEAEAEAEAEE